MNFINSFALWPQGRWDHHYYQPILCDLDVFEPQSTSVPWAVRALLILLELSELCVGSPQHPHPCHPLNPSPTGERPKLKGTSQILEPCQSRTRKTKYYVLPKPVVLQPERAEESPGNWFNLWSFEAFLQRFWVSRSLDKVSVWPVVFKPGGMLES